MRAIEEYKTTTNSRVYNMMMRECSSISCPICGPNKGCNRYREYGNLSWKGKRKTQWKEIL